MGIFNGSELHLTPLNGIVSLKPSLQYLDKSDRTAKSEGRSKLNESSQVRKLIFFFNFRKNINIFVCFYFLKNFLYILG